MDKGIDQLREWRGIQGCKILDALSLNIVLELSRRNIKHSTSRIVMQHCIRSIVKIFGKTVLLWPNQLHITRKHRQDKIRKDRMTMSYSEVSIKWNLSERVIRRILSEPRDGRQETSSQSIVDLENILVTELINLALFSRTLTSEIARKILAATHRDIDYKSSAYIGDYTVLKHEHLKYRIKSMGSRPVEEIAMILGLSEVEICRLQKQYKDSEATVIPRASRQKITYRKKRIMNHIHKYKHKSTDIYEIMELLPTDITTARVALNELISEGLLYKQMIKAGRSRRLIYSLSERAS